MAFMRRLALLLACLFAAVPAAVAVAHPERTTFFPDHTKGERPAYKNTGGKLIVCQPDSRERINKIWSGDDEQTSFDRRLKLKQLARCKFDEVQEAVDAAKSGDRIWLMPGVYTEEPSRAR